MKITVYGTTSCPYCFALKDWLDEKKVKYEYFFVDQDQRAAQEMIQRGGQGGVPFSTIEDGDGKIQSVLGFDRAKFKELLNI